MLCTGGELELTIWTGIVFKDESSRSTLAKLRTGCAAAEALQFSLPLWLLLACSVTLLLFNSPRHAANPRVERPAIVSIRQITADGAIKTPKLVLVGDRLYFNENPKGLLSLFQMPLHGGTPSSAPASFAHQWSSPLDAPPDGSELLFRTSGGLISWSWVQDRSRLLSDLPCDFAKWSPDSSRIACAADDDLYTSMLMGAESGCCAGLSRFKNLSGTRIAGRFASPKQRGGQTLSSCVILMS